MNSSGSGSDELPISTEQAKKQNFKFDFASFKRLISNIFPTNTDPQNNINLDGTDATAILFFTALGMITRIFRIQFPSSIVFDEGLYGNFTNSYLRGQYFHDNNPPLSKLIITGIAHYAGYNGEYNFYKPEFPTMTYVAMRITPAFFGALCVPISYLLMRFMMCSHFTSFFSALLVTTDLILIVESRHFLTDGILHFFVCLSLFSVFLYERNSSSIFAFIFEGLCLGCAAACKYTSLGLIMFSIIRQFCLKNSPFFYGFVRSFLLILIICIVHLTCFTVHLMVLPYLPDEAFLTDSVFIPKSVRKGLIDRLNSDWDARAGAPSLITRVFDLVFTILSNSLKSSNSRKNASKWWKWPVFDCNWVPFWSANGKHIVCLGNVLLWYPVFFGILWNLVVTFIRRDFSSLRSCLLFGYSVSILQFALIPRNLCIFHYAIPLIFGVYNLAVMIEVELRPVVRGFVYSMLIAFAVFGYFNWSCLVYGLSTPDLEFLIWNKKWTEGVIDSSL